MQHDLATPAPEAPHGTAFWWATVSLAVLLMATFWLVCNRQVELAQARSAEAQMAQEALADCLQYIPGATVASCTQRIAPEGVQTAAVQGATTVSYRIR